MAREVTCECCGKTFTAPNKRVHKYCSEKCQVEMNRRIARERRRELREQEKLTKEKKLKTYKSLDKAITKYGTGSDYGKNVALEYMKKHPIIKKKFNEKVTNK